MNRMEVLGSPALIAKRVMTLGVSLLILGSSPPPIHGHGTEWTSEEGRAMWFRRVETKIFKLKSLIVNLRPLRKVSCSQVLSLFQWSNLGERRLLRQEGASSHQCPSLLEPSFCACMCLMPPYSFIMLALPSLLTAQRGCGKAAEPNIWLFHFFLLLSISATQLTVSDLSFNFISFLNAKYVFSE